MMPSTTTQRRHLDHDGAWGTTLAATINVQAVSNKPENLPLNQDVPPDGSATIEIKYL